MQITNRPSYRLGLWLTAIILLSACGASAATWGGGDRVHISNLHNIDGDLYAVAGNVLVEGPVTGDVFAGGQHVTCEGEVGGSISAWAYDFQFRGRSTGSIRAAGMSVAIDGFVGRSLLAAGETVRVGSRATVRHEAYVRAAQAVVSGVVMGNLDFEGDRLDLTGEIGGDVTATAKKISIQPPALIKGNLRYMEGAEVEIDSLGGVTILGTIEEIYPELDESDDQAGFLSGPMIALSKLIAAFLFGLILLYVFRRYAKQTCHQLRTRPSVAAATGLLTIIVSVISLVVVVMSAFLLLLGFAMVNSNDPILGSVLVVLSIIALPVTGFVSVTGTILLYTGKITVAMVAGYLGVRLLKKEPALMSKTQLLLGLIVTTLLFSIPAGVGTLLWILASIVGAGGIVLGIRHCQPVTSNNLPAAPLPEEPPAPDPTSVRPPA